MRARHGGLYDARTRARIASGRVESTYATVRGDSRSSAVRMRATAGSTAVRRRCGHNVNPSAAATIATAAAGNTDGAIDAGPVAMTAEVRGANGTASTTTSSPDSRSAPADARTRAAIAGA